MASVPHWLPLGVRRWLERQARIAWVSSTSALLKDHPACHGREVEVAEACLSTADELEEQWTREGKGEDEQGRTHVRTAALVLGTYKGALPWLRHIDALELVRRQTMSAGEVLGTATKASMFLTFDPYARIRTSLRLLLLDYGSSFRFEDEIEEESGQEMRRTTTVKQCLYRSLFEKEGVPELAEVTCCSIDSIYFTSMAAAAPDKVKFALERAKEERGPCTFTIERL